MTDYADKVVGGDYSGPEQLTADKPRRIEISTAAPTVEGIPVSHTEKRFHDDALAIMAGEEADAPPAPPSHNEVVAWKLACIDGSMNMVVTSLRVAVQILKSLDPKDMPREPTPRADAALYNGAMLIQELARLHGRDYMPPASFVLMDMALAQTAAPRRHKLPPGMCASCDRERAAGNEHHPWHDASRNCESGKHPHCTCDACF